MSTKLLYMEHMHQLVAQARVIDVIAQDDIYTVILDQTIFYPQGGGQPSDKGFIKNEQASFQVQSVSKHEDIVYHKGVFEHGVFKAGDLVTLYVDESLRALHNMNHTGGHLIDYALEKLGYALIPAKGYHFPQGPYVEYQGVQDDTVRAHMLEHLEKEVNALITPGIPVQITFLENDPKKRGMFLEGYQPILCGGTHVANTNAIKRVIIRKIKNEKGNLRVSYAVE